MLTGRELHRHFRLAATKMAMVFVCRDRGIQGRQTFRIDQQMMMTGRGALHTRRRHAHATEPETDHNRAADRLAVSGRNKINRRTLRCRRGLQHRTYKKNHEPEKPSERSFFIHSFDSLRS